MGVRVSTSVCDQSIRRRAARACGGSPPAERAFGDVDDVADASGALLEFGREDSLSGDDDLGGLFVVRVSLVETVEDSERDEGGGGGETEELGDDAEKIASLRERRASASGDPPCRVEGCCGREHARADIDEEGISEGKRLRVLASVSARCASAPPVVPRTARPDRVPYVDRDDDFLGLRADDEDSIADRLCFAKTSTGGRARARRASSSDP